MKRVVMPFGLSFLVVSNLVVPKGEERRLYGTLFHEMRHLTGTWNSVKRENLAVAVMDSYIDAVHERVVLPCALVCRECGFATPVELEEKEDDGRVSTGDKVIRALGTEPRNATHLERHWYKPTWTTYSHIHFSGYTRESRFKN